MLSPKIAPKGFRSGFIALIGRPNVGKSTLINKFIGKKVAITSPIAQTTRNRLKAILTIDNAQIVMVDTPGIHKPHHLLGERLVKSAKASIGEVDAILLILDSSHPPGKGDNFIVKLLQQQQIPIIVALNKWDLVSKEISQQRNLEYKFLLEKLNWPIYICSALTGEGSKNIIEDLRKYLPNGPYLYPPEVISDQPEKVLMSELIREQVLLQTKEEVPHSVAIKIERIEQLDKKENKSNSKLKTAILATILVESKSQKSILIGKNGRMVKSIGTASRLQIEKLIEGKIYLELFVKVVPGWRNKPSKLLELGYEES